MSDIADLIDRLAAAPNGDRRLDEDIATAVRSADAVLGHDGVGRSVAPEFTTSLDAAMLLLPVPGMNRCWGVSENPDRDDPRPMATVMLWEPTIEALSASLRPQQSPSASSVCRRATP